MELPIDVHGDRHFVVVTDATNKINELAGEANNRDSRPVSITLAPFANLVVTGVTAPTDHDPASVVIGDPAEITVSWTVENRGTGEGRTHAWTDAVVLSTDQVLGDADDVVIATFEHAGPLTADGSPQSRYSRSENILLPPAFTGQYYVFVRTDDAGAVFENGQESDNSAAADGLLEVMPIPYADLVVPAIEVPAEAFAGRPLELTWTVENQGIGLTSRGDWIDRAYLARHPDGSEPLEETETQVRAFRATGHRAATTNGPAVIAVPDGLSGTYYVVVEAAWKNAPFEFVYTDNNASVSAAIPITVLPLPDLAVTSVVAPLAAEEGTLVDFSWTVENRGPGAAEGSWVDRVYLQEAGNPDAEIVELGRFVYTGPLPAGQSYRRAEALQVPVQTNELYRVFVTTDFEENVYEGDATANNTLFRDDALAISAKPRPTCRCSRSSSRAGSRRVRR